MDLVETELDEAVEFDKIFSSCWYNSNRVLAGTKSNKLLSWSFNGKKKSFEVVPLLNSGKNISPDSCGIHSISVNPSSSLLVTGAVDPSELGVYSLPKFSPEKILTGHKNWSFSCAFLNDNCVISGSKDKTVCLWKLNENQELFILPPYLRKIVHKDKIRDLKALNRLKAFATLSSDHTIKIWDQETFEMINNFYLEDMSELVCMAFDEVRGLLAIGSKLHTSLFDIRSNKLLQNISIPDGRVRSLNFYGNYVSMGGGGGYLSFYDLQKMGYSKLNSKQDIYYYMSGKGWKESDTQGAHAIFTHNYNPEGNMLFVAGGPLNSSSLGCYSAIWSKPIV